MSIRTPLAKAKGLGSAHNGTHHFIVQRISAIFLIITTLYFPFAINSLIRAEGYAGTIDWFNNPINAAMSLIFVLAGFYHGALGLQVVIEDYVHNNNCKIASLIAIKIVLAIFALIATLSIFKLALA